MASLLFCCPSACAGTYVWQTTDASGTVTARSPVISGGFWYTYGDSPKPYSIGYSGSGGSAETGGYAGQISSSGTIRTVYTWQPSYAGEPAPPVVIEQTCEANYLCQTASAPADPCSNGLDDPLVDSSSGDTYKGKSSGTHYRVVSPDATGKIMVDLVGAQAHAPASSFTNCTVWYTINAYPVTINLTGQNTANQALTGQQITATLNGVLSGVKVTSYTWSFSGATAPNPIKNWDGNGTDASGKPQQLFPLTVADLKGTDTSGSGISVNPVSFYDDVADNVTVKCAVGLKFPDGTTATVNAQSVPVAFLKPMETWGVLTLTKEDGPYARNYNSDGTTFNPLYGAQVTWNPINITVPAPFTGGVACLVQIITASNRVDTRKADDGTLNTYVPLMPSPDGSGTKIQVSGGLDTGFPYHFAYQLNKDGDLVPDANGKYTVKSPPQWDVSTATGGINPGAGGDNPSIACEPPLVPHDTGGHKWRASTASDTFDTWTMYKPPVFGTQGTIWVPLRKLSWGWSGSMKVVVDASDNPVLDSKNNVQWAGALPKIDPTGKAADATDFPQWDRTVPLYPPMGPPPPKPPIP